MNYKDFIEDFIKGHAAKKRGEYGRIAKAAGISSTLVSQIFKGERELSLEQAFLISSYLNLNNEESDYFELLVLFRRAGIKKQQEHYLKKIKRIQEKHKSFKSKMNVKSLDMTSENEIKYYTEWIHSAIRLLSEIRKYQTIESLAQKLKVDEDEVKKSAEFLSSINLVEYNSGKVTGLKNNIHLEKSSPLTYLRQLTWRMKALENFQRKNPEDFTFNALVTLEKGQIEKIKEIIKSSVSEIGASTEKTKNPEEMMCLNIDFFKV